MHLIETRAAYLRRLLLHFWPRAHRKQFKPHILSL